MDNSNISKFVICDISNQLEISNQIQNLKGFIFRGHCNSDWVLESSFEREYKKYTGSPHIRALEHQAIEFFKKRAHLYGVGNNLENDMDHVVSIMQHYGCPTRLIDFTRSFYVATYFAVSDVSSQSKQYSIWALNFDKIDFYSRRLKNEHSEKEILDRLNLSEILYDIFSTNPVGIIPVEPRMISQRMSSQQGILLAQTNLHYSFIDNLCIMLDINPDPQIIPSQEFSKMDAGDLSKIHIIKFNFSTQHAQRIRQELLSMNITSEIIFPDLAGLAKSAMEHALWKYNT